MVTYRPKPVIRPADDALSKELFIHVFGVK